MPRRDIEFKTVDQVTLRGWLYTPIGASESSRLPCLIMAHGWACLKEMELPKLAEHFVANLQISVLIYDHRGFGTSDTAPNCPRREIVPSQQVSDMSDAITYAASLSETVDPKKIGIWGYSYAGGHVISVAAGDLRVRAVISQNPVVSGHNVVRRWIRSDFIGISYAAFADDRQARASGGSKATTFPVVDADPLAPVSTPSQGAYQWYSEWEKKCAWKNEVTIRSTYLLMSHEPMGQIQYISPRPLLMIVAENDAEASADVALEAYAKAKEPKELQLIQNCGHFDMFEGDVLKKTLEVQTQFLKKWLCP